MTEREDADRAHGDVRFTALDRTLAEIKAHVQHIPQMRKDIAETREIVAAWNTVKNGGRFVKWMGGIAAAFAAMWVLAKGLFRGLFP